jgi:hypothetical protein
MDNLRRDVVPLEEISQPQKSHEQEVDPDEFTDGPVIVL